MAMFTLNNCMIISLTLLWSLHQVKSQKDNSTILMRNDDQQLRFKTEVPFILYTRKEEYTILTCESFNFSSIHWYMNGIPYDSWRFGQNGFKTKYRLLSDNQTLEFTYTDCDAEGNYTCIVSNGVQTIRREQKLFVDDAVWVHKPILKNENSSSCQSQTAVLGGNASFFCKFAYHNDNGNLDCSWRKLNETSTYYTLVSFYNIPNTRFEERCETSLSNSTSMSNPYCTKSKPLYTQSMWLNIINVTKEALGQYLVSCQIVQFYTAHNLTLELEQPEPVITDISTIPIMITVMTLFFIACGLLWKQYGIDIKLWRHEHLNKKSKEDDGKVYDAYIIASSDQSFVLNILYPTLRDKYKIFWRERDVLPGDVTSKKVTDTLDISRRCIVVLSPDFNSSPPPTSVPSFTSSSSSPSSSSSSSSPPLQPTPSSPSTSSSSFSSEVDWHWYELKQALDTKNMNDIIPIIYTEFNPSKLLATKDSHAKMIDNLIQSRRCLQWKQKGKSRLDERAWKLLRLHLPPWKVSTKEYDLNTTAVSFPLSRIVNYIKRNYKKRLVDNETLPDGFKTSI